MYIWRKMIHVIMVLLHELRVKIAENSRWNYMFMLLLLRQLSYLCNSHFKVFLCDMDSAFSERKHTRLCANGLIDAQGERCIKEREICKQMICDDKMRWPCGSGRSIWDEMHHLEWEKMEWGISLEAVWCGAIICLMTAGYSHHLDFSARSTRQLVRDFLQIYSTSQIHLARVDTENIGASLS